MSQAQGTGPVRVQVLGLPIAKGRPRLGKHGAYTPERTTDAEDAITVAMLAACQSPLAGPLGVILHFVFPIPKRVKAGERLIMEEDEPYRMGKPDLDNLCKLVLDAANGILWTDDGQVVKLEAHKTYGADAGTTIEVHELEDDVTAVLQGWSTQAVELHEERWGKVS